MFRNACSSLPNRLRDYQRGAHIGALAAGENTGVLGGRVRTVALDAVDAAVAHVAAHPLVIARSHSARRRRSRSDRRRRPYPFSSSASMPSSGVHAAKPLRSLALAESTELVIGLESAQLVVGEPAQFLVCHAIEIVIREALELIISKAVEVVVCRTPRCCRRHRRPGPGRANHPARRRGRRLRPVLRCRRVSGTAWPP